MNSTVARQLRAIVVEFVFAKDLQQATQDIRDEISEHPQRPAARDEGAGPHAVRSRTTCRSCRSTLSSRTLDAGGADALADPDITRQLRGIPRRRGGRRRRRRRARAGRRAAARRDCRRPASASAQVVQALQAQNLAAPVGRLDGDLDERTIRLRGRLETPADFAQLVVAQRNGRIVRLGDVATVHDGTEEPRSAALYDGERSRRHRHHEVEGLQHDDGRATVAREGRASIQKTLPAGVKLRRRARRRHARRATRCATSKRRWSKARC